LIVVFETDIAELTPQIHSGVASGKQSKSIIMAYNVPTLAQIQSTVADVEAKGYGALFLTQQPLDTAYSAWGNTWADFCRAVAA
jgi:hypothetical protein